MKTVLLVLLMAAIAAISAPVGFGAPTSRIVFGGHFTEAMAIHPLVAADAEGNTYLADTREQIVYRLERNGGTYFNFWVFLEKVSAAGDVVFVKTIPGGTVNAITVTPSGNVVIAGSWAYNDAGALSATGGAVQATKIGGYVAEVSPDGTLVFLATLAGSPLAAAVDASGTIYLTGTVQAGAVGNAFAAKISSDGSTLIYSTSLGQIYSGMGIAVNASGAAFIAANTEPGPFTRTQSHIVVIGLDAAGGHLLFQSALSGSGDDEARGIAIDSAGFLYVAGSTTSTDFPVTPGAYQFAYPGGSNAGFVTKLDSLGGVVFSTFLGSSGVDAATGVLVDNLGRLIVTHSSSSTSGWGSFYSVLAGRPARPCDPASTALVMDRETGKITDLEGLIGMDNASIATDRAGILHTTGAAGANSTFAMLGGGGFFNSSTRMLVRYDLSRSDDFLPLCVVNRADGVPAAFESPLAPGQLISIYGTGLGPTPGVQAIGGATLPASLGNVQLTIAGSPLALLYVSGERIDGFVPYSWQSSWRQGSTIDSMTIRSRDFAASYPLMTGPVSPGIFTADGTGIGQAAALNQDGTVNSVQNPAARGSIVSLFVTGLGALSLLPVADDAWTGVSPPFPTVSAYVRVSCQSPSTGMTDAIWAGLAPAQPPGVYQVNLSIPANATVGKNAILVESMSPSYPLSWAFSAYGTTWIAVK